MENIHLPYNLKDWDLIDQKKAFIFKTGCYFGSNNSFPCCNHLLAETLKRSVQWYQFFINFHYFMKICVLVFDEVLVFVSCNIKKKKRFNPFS